MTIMKIIDGLYFTIGMILFNPLTGESKTPEQLNEDDRTTYDACMGAIALLKAQEPRVMTLEEIVGWEGAFWLEFLEEENESYTRYGYAFFAGSTPDVIEVIARDSFRPLYAFIRSEYRIRWRCWTSRPTDEQREAIPWG